MLRPVSLARVARVLLAAAGDAAIAFGSVALVVFVRTHVDVPLTRELLPPGKFPLNATNLLVFAGALVAALALGGFYEFSGSHRHRPTLFVALPLQMGFVAVAGTMGEISWPRTVFVAVPMLEAAAIPVWRWVVRLAWREEPPHAAIVGDAASIRRFISHVPDTVVPRALVTVDDAIDAPAFSGRITEPRAMDAIVDADEVIDLGGGDVHARRLTLLEARGPRGYLCVPLPEDSLLTPSRFGMLGDRLLVDVSMPGACGVGAVMKRCFDLVVAAVLFVVALPLLVVIALLVAIDSRGPVLLRQTRAGLAGVPFGMWKFRTMRAGETGTQRASDGDERVTRVGRWLRRYRLDELPQLVNVLGGSMSLVGPRPEMPELVESIASTVPHFRLRLFARPGIAGLAQVSAEYDQSPEVKLVYDLQYLCRWSPALDLSILVRSVVTALSGRGV